MSTPQRSRLLLLPGEPAGIGPDLMVMMAQQAWPVSWMTLADPELLRSRAHALNLPLRLVETDPSMEVEPFVPGTLPVWPLSLPVPGVCGRPDADNAQTVLRALQMGCEACLQGKFSGMVTGPVHKATLCSVQPTFKGHTEYLAELCGVEQSVMLFTGTRWRVALATTHIPLSDVPAAITKPHLRRVLQVLRQGLQRFFLVDDPHICVLGLNPHAGEEGAIGCEEKDIIIPLLSELREEGMRLSGPIPADSAFTELTTGGAAAADAVLSMYHDQTLPVLKTQDFGALVNMTLGLPFVRTSVDHGTALDLAGTGRIHSQGMRVAMTLAARITTASELCTDHA